MPASTPNRSMTRLLLVCLAIELSCSYAIARKAVPRAAVATQDKDKKHDKDENEKKNKKDDKDAQKIEVRNNAASLLADLLGDDKNVSKLLIIKHVSPQTEQLIKTISKAADDGGKQLDALAKADSALKLDAMQLPPGEKEARDGESKAKEHELLFSSGARFEFNLLLAQAEALNYGSHLAKVAADNSSAPEAQREFHSLETSLNDLYERVVGGMRSLPQSKT
jgi:hypothetical protein